MCSKTPQAAQVSGHPHRWPAQIHEWPCPAAATGRSSVEAHGFRGAGRGWLKTRLERIGENRRESKSLQDNK